MVLMGEPPLQTGGDLAQQRYSTNIISSIIYNATSQQNWRHTCAGIAFRGRDVVRLRGLSEETANRGARAKLGSVDLDHLVPELFGAPDEQTRQQPSTVKYPVFVCFSGALPHATLRKVCRFRPFFFFFLSHYCNPEL